jgi:hypothetical protein
MKKSILSVLAIVSVLSFSSCKKDYVCKCSKTYTSGSGSYTQNYSTYTYRDTRTDAESRCNANRDSGTDLYGDYSVNCQIQ